ncbi:MAG TPA: hypothetical protein VIL30_18645, partial [Ramlibacter sp.]
MEVLKKSLPARGPVHELLAAGIATQVPRLEALMARLKLQGGIVEEVQLEDALHALHASADGLDFRLLQVEGSNSFAIRKARAGGAAFSLQASRLRSEAAKVWAALQTVVAGNERQAASVPPLLSKFRSAAEELGQSVDLAALLTDRSLEAAPAASELHEKLARLQAFCADARRALRLAQERSAGRLALQATLQERVIVPCNELQDSLRPLLAAAEHPAGTPAAGIAAALERRQRLQAGIVQGCAEIVRLH